MRPAHAFEQVVDVPLRAEFAGPPTVGQLPCGVGDSSMLLVHIKHDLFKTRFEAIGVTAFVSASRKGGDERRNGIVPPYATGPILSTRPPNVLVISRRPADAIVFYSARTLDLKRLGFEPWKVLWNDLERKSNLLSSHSPVRGPSATSPGAWLRCCLHAPGARVVHP